MLERLNLTVVPKHPHMAPPGAESKTLRDLFGEDLDEEVDYESDSQFVGPNGSPLTTMVKTTKVVHLVQLLNMVLRTRLQRYATRLTLRQRLRSSQTRSTSSNSNKLLAKIA